MRHTLALFASTVALAAGGAPADHSARLHVPAQPDRVDSCGAEQSDLVSSTHVDTGAVRIDNDGENLIIHVVTQDGWELAAVNIFAAKGSGTASAPANKRGTVLPSSFPFQTTYSSTVSVHTQVIPLDVIDAVCGDSIHTVVHAVVRRPLENGGSQEESVFGDGTPLPASLAGFSSAHDICC